MLYLLTFCDQIVSGTDSRFYYVYDTDDMSLERWRGSVIYDCYSRGIGFGCVKEHYGGSVKFTDCSRELGSVKRSDITLIQTLRYSTWEGIEVGINLWYSGFMYTVTVNGSRVVGRLTVNTLGNKHYLDCKCSFQNILALAVRDELEQGRLVLFLGDSLTCPIEVGMGMEFRRASFNKNAIFS